MSDEHHNIHHEFGDLSGKRHNIHHEFGGLSGKLKTPAWLGSHYNRFLGGPLCPPMTLSATPAAAW